MDMGGPQSSPLHAHDVANCVTNEVAYSAANGARIRPAARRGESQSRRKGRPDLGLTQETWEAEQLG